MIYNWNGSFVNQGEIDKLSLNIENLWKSNKISIKFSIRYFIDFIVENTVDKEKYCLLFIQRNGIDLILEKINLLKEN